MGILLVDMVSPFYYGRCHYLPAQILCKPKVSPIRSLFTYLITLFHTGGGQSYWFVLQWSFFLLIWSALFIMVAVITSQSKLRLETKETKVSPKILLVKSSRNNFFTCILPDYVMKASKNFEKTAILKI